MATPMATNARMVKPSMMGVNGSATPTPMPGGGIKMAVPEELYNNSTRPGAPPTGGYDSSGINPQPRPTPIPQPPMQTTPAPRIVPPPPMPEPPPPPIYSVPTQGQGQMQPPPRAPLQPPPGLPPRPGQGTTQNPGGIIPPHMQQGAPPAMEPMGQRMPAPPQAPTMPAGQAYQNRPMSNNGAPTKQRRPVGRPITFGMMGRRR